MDNKKSGGNIYQLAAIITLGIVVVFLVSNLISANVSWLESFSKNGEIDPLCRYVALGIAGLVIMFIGLINVKNFPAVKSKNPYDGLLSITLFVVAVAVATGNFTDLFIFLFIIPIGIYYIRTQREQKSKK